MMQEILKNSELVSMLTDGCLDGEEFTRTVEWLGTTEDALLTWHAYQVVGDVLRSGESLVGGCDTAFMQRLRLRLHQEPPLASKIDAAYLIAQNSISTWTGDENSFKTTAANDTRFHWKLVAGLASVVFLSFVAWQVSGIWGDQTVSPQLARMPVPSVKPEVGSQQATAVVGGESQVMIRDRQLDALLAAHKQFGGTSALQMSAGFLRNATFEGGIP